MRYIAMQGTCQCHLVIFFTQEWQATVENRCMIDGTVFLSAYI